MQNVTDKQREVVDRLQTRILAAIADGRSGEVRDLSSSLAMSIDKLAMLELGQDTGPH